MATTTSELRQEHETLRKQLEEILRLARVVCELDDTRRESARDAIAGRLRKNVVPHTWIDERVLYPRVVERLGDPLATASMNYDHAAIRQWVDEIATCDPRDAQNLQQLLYGLHALIDVHIWKEEELYISALGSSSWPN